MKEAFSLILILVLLLCFCACGKCDTQPTEPSTTVDLSKAQKSAALQEARNCYTEAYALDIQDGVIDGTTDNGITAIADRNYVVASGVATYTYFSRGYTVSFDGTNWTITAN